MGASRCHKALICLLKNPSGLLMKPGPPTKGRSRILSSGETAQWPMHITRRTQTRVRAKQAVWVTLTTMAWSKEYTHSQSTNDLAHTRNKSAGSPSLVRFTKFPRSEDVKTKKNVFKNVMGHGGKKKLKGRTSKTTCVIYPDNCHEGNGPCVLMMKVTNQPALRCFLNSIENWTDHNESHLLTNTAGWTEKLRALKPWGKKAWTRVDFITWPRMVSWQLNFFCCNLL